VFIKILIGRTSDVKQENQGHNGATQLPRPRRFIVGLIACCLCACSILQLSIATEMMRHTNALLQKSGVEPPLAIKYLFPLWTRGARLDWELALVVIYVLTFIWALRVDRKGPILRLVLLWIVISTVLFAGVWLAILPYRVCCV
jgi:hypothetical protein